MVIPGIHLLRFPSHSRSSQIGAASAIHLVASDSWGSSPETSAGGFDGFHHKPGALDGDFRGSRALKDAVFFHVCHAADAGAFPDLVA